MAAEPLHHGTGQPDALGRAARRRRGLGATLFGGRSGRARRLLAAASGITPDGGLGLHPLRVFEAGLESAKDPRYTMEPQRRRLEARRAAGITDDSIIGLVRICRLPGAEGSAAVRWPMIG